MTAGYSLSPKAQVDLGQVWDYTVERWGIDQAEFYIRQIWQHIELIANQPALGRPCAEVREGYYKYPVGAHFLFYRLSAGEIDIVRILHQRMDFRSNL